MFNNVGDKIKIIAKFYCWLGIVSSVIIGIYIFAQGKYFVIIGFLLPFIGSLIFWVMSLFIYGFGELICNTSNNNEDIKTKSVNNDVKVENKYKNVEKKENIITEANENNIAISDYNIKESEFVDIECPNCNENLSFIKGHIVNCDEIICPMCDCKIDINRE